MDRDLPIWFHETARPRLPDYTDDVIRQATAIRQRPRWTFLERWLPVAVSLDRVPVAPLPWRRIGLLVALGLLAVAAVVAVGSRPRLPEPFGRAANGLVAYGWGGDIFTVDPGTGARRGSSPGRPMTTIPASRSTGPTSPSFEMRGTIDPGWSSWTRTATIHRCRDRRSDQHRHRWDLMVTGQPDDRARRERFRVAEFVPRRRCHRECHRPRRRARLHGGLLAPARWAAADVLWRARGRSGPFRAFGQGRGRGAPADARRPPR